MHEGGTVGGGRARQAVVLRDVRLLAGGRASGRTFRIAFTPTESVENAILEVAEAGDSTAIKRTDLTIAAGADQVALNHHAIRLVANQRISLEVFASGSIDGRSWRVQARAVAPRTEDAL